MKKTICTLLIIIVVLSAVPISTAAIPTLPSEKQEFLDMVTAAAVANMPISNVLASVTIAQAIMESGWGQDPMPKATKNLFCIKAYTTWKGKVYCHPTGKFYNSLQELIETDKATYNKYVDNFYRVYDSYYDSIKDHGELMNKERYAAIPGNDDYKDVCRLLVECGYTSVTAYTTGLIKIIEDYELYKHDSLEASVNASSVTLNTNVINLKNGNEYQLTATVMPTNTKDKTVTYKSSDTSVATVTNNGKVKAIKTGIATITATTTNGKTATATVYCSKSGTIIYNAVTLQSVYCRAKMDTNSTIYGSLAANTQVVITGNAVNGWYLVTGKNSSGITLHGYVYASYIKITGIKETDKVISTPHVEPPTVEAGSGTNLSSLTGKLGSVASNQNNNPVLGGYSDENGYYIITVINGGKTTVGWWSGDYFEVQKQEFVAKNALGESCYIDADGYFRGVPAGTTIGELSELYDGIIITIQSKREVTLKADDIVCTGDGIILRLGDTKIYEGKIVVMGDVTGDGVINSLDYMNVRNTFIGVKSLENAYLKAADINHDGMITPIDYFSIFMLAQKIM